MSLKNLLIMSSLGLIFLSCMAAEPSLGCQAYCVIDATSQTMLKSKSHLEKMPPASTIKLLTAIVVLDSKMPLDRMLTVSKQATLVEATHLSLKEGDQLSCRDLLLAILVQSANDAAIVLAEGVAGSVEKFAELMNQKATQIGCQNSFFVNPNGLPSNPPSKQYSCAYDLALIAYTASTFPVIREMLAMPKATIQMPGRTITLKTHNELLKNPKWLILGKTGYTKSSLNTFAGFVEINGKLLVISVLASPKRKIMWQEIVSLLDLQPAAATLPTSGKLEKTTTNIQLLLQKKGYYTGKIDGKLGPQTQAAIKKFQEANGLTVDGVVGPKTWQKLSQE